VHLEVKSLAALPAAFDLKGLFHTSMWHYLSHPIYPL
jgi:hypothetical protein